MARTSSSRRAPPPEPTGAELTRLQTQATDITTTYPGDEGYKALATVQVPLRRGIRPPSALHELLPRADYVVIATPGSAETAQVRDPLLCVRRSGMLSGVV